MLIYNLIIYLIQPILLFRLLWKSIRNSDYRKRLKERYGFYSKRKITKKRSIVFHAVSIGEVMSIVPIINILLNRYPSISIVVTTTTPTSSKQILSIFKDKICHVYFPYDLPGAIRRFFSAIDPKLFIIVETEFWPNLFFELKRRNIPLIVGNARLSQKSFKNYKKIQKLFFKMMQCVTFVIAKDYENGNKFLELGLNKKKLLIFRNLKFDISVSSSLKDEYAILKKNWILNRKVWIASNTHVGEEKLILKAHYELLKEYNDLILILAPRYPERCKALCNMIKKINLKYLLLSKKVNFVSKEVNVIIVDTIGKLKPLYAISDLAFIGGSLLKKYFGHNPLEAVINSIPVLIGPYTRNCDDICEELYSGNGLIRITGVDSLIQNISILLKEKDLCIKYGKNAYKILVKNKGASKFLFELIRPFL